MTEKGRQDFFSFWTSRNILFRSKTLSFTTHGLWPRDCFLCHFISISECISLSLSFRFNCGAIDIPLLAPLLLWLFVSFPTGSPSFRSVVKESDTAKEKGFYGEGGCHM